MMDYILDTSYISASYWQCSRFGRCQSHWGLLNSCCLRGQHHTASCQQCRHFDWRQIYWRLLDSGCPRGPCYTIEHVIREILDWDNQPDGWVEGEQDWLYLGSELVYEIWGLPLHRFNADKELKSVELLVKADYPNHKEKVDGFLHEDKADARLIAQAMKDGSTVVTMEKPGKGNGPPKIPDVCRAFEVRCIHPDEFLMEVHPNVALCDCLYC